ncbi:putative pentatricopeptide repeat-containing protein At1g64310 [Typha latifolia]|uniref:putative pentatricopeptide repeat-containing protein At1g64310 n=1 Tax=Typha latifolia TaxID=4733 RepID=UPI003C2DCB41
MRLGAQLLDSSLCLTLYQTKQLHALLLTAHHHASDPLLLLATTAKLLRSYAANGDLVSAHHLFDQTPHPSAFLWNTIIRAHALRRDFSRAFSLFSQMRRRSDTNPDGYTFACVLRACSDNSDPNGAKMVHKVILSSGLDSDRIAGSALVSVYSKLGLVDDAWNMFHELSKPDLVLWNSMISGYGYRGLWQEGLELFRRMRAADEKPDGYTLVGLISCFWDPRSLRFGRGIHALCFIGGYDSNPHVRSVLVSMYSRCECLLSAYRVFGDLLQPDLVTWSALITGLLQAGKCDASLTLFRSMTNSGKRPDHVLIASILSACASMAAIGHGKEIHGYALRLGIVLNITVSSALVDTYAKCGLAGLGFRVFESIPDKNLVTYNTVIASLGSHGFANEAIRVFDEMLDEGLRPDSGTFSALLCACCYSGLLDEGWELFRRMGEEFGLEIQTEHYVYMVKLLATVGCINEAYDLIQTMPMASDCGVWGAFLWGCCVHGNSDMGRIAAERLFELQPGKTAYRVMLSNLYASKEMWWDVETLRGDIMVGGLHKSPGISWVGDGNL